MITFPREIDFTYLDICIRCRVRDNVKIRRAEFLMRYFRPGIFSPKADYLDDFVIKSSKLFLNLIISEISGEVGFSYLEFLFDTNPFYLTIIHFARYIL